MSNFILNSSWGRFLNEKIRNREIFNLTRNYAKELMKLKRKDENIFELLNV
jgi:hypothetical protein